MRGACSKPAPTASAPAPAWPSSENSEGSAGSGSEIPGGSAPQMTCEEGNEHHDGGKRGTQERAECQVIGLGSKFRIIRLPRFSGVVANFEVVARFEIFIRAGSEVREFPDVPFAADRIFVNHVPVSDSVVP